MLMELVEILKERSALSKNEIAFKLNISETMVDALLFELERLGYISAEKCTGGCTSCGRCAGIKNSGRTFILNV